MIDYAAFKLRAVVDWVEIQVTLARPTQPRHVRDRIRRELPHWGEPPYVKALTNASSRTADTIAFRVQDPSGPATLLREVQAVAHPGDPPLTERNIQVVGIEIALDAYVSEQSHEALAAMALHMFRHHARPPAQGPGSAPRITEPGHFRFADGGRDSQQALTQGFTINASSDDGDYRARYYVKTTDSIDGMSYATLPAAQHRARMEVTLRGAEMPFTSIASWESFRFETLASRFGMRRPTIPKVKPHLLALARLLQARTVQFGMPANAAKLAQHKRTNRAWTRADETWAGHARDALRALSRAQSKGSGIR